MASRYQKAKRSERSQLLTEMEQVSKLHRKHLIRLLNGESLERQKRQKSRNRTYGLEGLCCKNSERNAMGRRLPVLAQLSTSIPCEMDKAA